MRNLADIKCPQCKKNDVTTLTEILGGGTLEFLVEDGKVSSSGVLDRLRAELYGKSKRIPFPELNKDCIQRVVQLNRTIRNKAGELFPEGTLMIVTQRHKRSKEVSIRPLNGSIRVSEDACNFLGDKDDFGFSTQQ